MTPAAWGRRWRCAHCRHRRWQWQPHGTGSGRTRGARRSGSRDGAGTCGPRPRQRRAAAACGAVPRHEHARQGGGVYIGTNADTKTQPGSSRRHDQRERRARIRPLQRPGRVRGGGIPGSWERRAELRRLRGKRRGGVMYFCTRLPKPNSYRSHQLSPEIPTPLAPAEASCLVLANGHRLAALRRRVEGPN